MTLGERIKYLRKEMNMTQLEFGKHIGVSGATISTSESGKTTPDSQTIEIICMKCNVNRDWLVDGIGEMRASRPLIPELMRVLRTYPALQAALEHVVDVMGLEEWDALNKVVEKVIEQQNK